MDPVLSHMNVVRSEEFVHVRGPELVFTMTVC
jgi:hypothetical protein